MLLGHAPENGRKKGGRGFSCGGRGVERHRAVLS
jgi:hypothetical protein